VGKDATVPPPTFENTCLDLMTKTSPTISGLLANFGSKRMERVNLVMTIVPILQIARHKDIFNNAYSVAPNISNPMILGFLMTKPWGNLSPQPEPLQISHFRFESGWSSQGIWSHSPDCLT
jgi:hypothetical protein